ncbi:hypothetical protein DPMN_134619 [Dreissena polymorpha]|uniref:Uncharacterized protein n=1 Tax=Dreissena polymorpha TaxID=45954 RepID=A0A9D4JC23_DREPO|nr:hypothetical protein DPMN_134619 [Dreissena polymorpha]
MGFITEFHGPDVRGKQDSWRLDLETYGSRKIQSFDVQKTDRLDKELCSVSSKKMELESGTEPVLNSLLSRWKFLWLEKCSWEHQ